MVTWDGGGGNTDWNTPANWSNDLLPGAADDVTINVGGSIVVTRASGASTINSLASTEGLMLSGGSLTINTASNVDGTLTIAGATFNTLAAFTANGSVDLQSGVISGVGNFTAAGGFAASTAANKFLTGKLLSLSGGGTWNSGDFALDEGAILNVPAGQTFDVRSNNSIRRNSGLGTATINSAGTITRTVAMGTAAFASNVGFNNTGSLSVQTGGLSLFGSGNHTGAFGAASGATLTFAGGIQSMNVNSSVSGAGVISFAGATATINGAFGSTGTVNVSSGTATINGNISLAALNLTGGILNGAGDIAISSLMIWSDGTLGGSGIVTPDGGLTITSAAVKRLTGKQLRISGGATWNGGDFAMDEGAILQIPAGQTFNPQNNNNLVRSSGIGSANVSVLGTFSKSVGTGTTSVGAGVGFSNDGLVQVQSGTLSLPTGGTHNGVFTVAAGATLDFSGGTHIVTAGGSISGSGNLRVSNGSTTVNGAVNLGGTATISSTNTATATFNGAFSVAGAVTVDKHVVTNFNTNVVFSSLSMGASGFNDTVLAGTGNIDVTGLTTWVSGYITGSGTFNANGGAAFNLVAQIATLEVRTFTLGANSTWTGGTILSMNQGATLVIPVGILLDNQSNGTISNGGGATPTITNNGTLRKSAGTGTTTIASGGVNFNNAGTVDVQTGTLLLAGNGTSTGSFTTSANTTLYFAGGARTYSLASVLSCGGNLVFSGGTHTVACPITVGGNLTVTSGSGSSTTFNGNVSVSGTATFSGNLTVTFNAAFTVSGAVTVDNHVVANFNTNVVFSSLSLGATGFADTVLAGSGHVTVTGLTTWVAGYIAGTGNFNANGGLFGNFISQNAHLEGKTLTLGANSIWTGGNQFLMGFGAVLVIPNGILLDNQSNGTIGYSGGAGGTINNSGTLRKSAGTGTTSIDGSVTFSNSGTIEVQTGTLSIGNLANFAGSTLTGGNYLVTGTLQFPNANIVTNAASITLIGASSSIKNSSNGNNALANLASNTVLGSIALVGGRSLTVPGTFNTAGVVMIVASSTFATAAGNYVQTGGSTTVLGTLDPFGSLNLQGGTLYGTGTVAGPLIVSGTGIVAPGTSPGILSVSGNFSLSSGTTLQAELNGAIAGADYDQIVVSGNVDVTGATLNLTRGFTPAGGVPFTIVDNAGSLPIVGTFAGFSDGATIVVGGLAFTISYAGGTGNDIVLTATADNAAAPALSEMYFDGASWTPSFRTAAGNSLYGYPAQAGGGQLTTLPWNSINTVYVKFSEYVNVDSSDFGIRGINVANYAITSFTYDNVNFVAKWVLSGPIDTDRIILDLDGDSATAVTDLAGNKLAGSWTEGVSAFPTSGAAGNDFRYRFVVAVGDADRNGIVRNPDTNLVRANLFIDAGAGGYNIFTDIDGNGLTRNADLNAVRGHLFIDPPAGSGPNRPVRGGNSSRSVTSRSGSVGFVGNSSGSTERISTSHRRLQVPTSVESLDALFAEFA